MRLIQMNFFSFSDWWLERIVIYQMKILCIKVTMDSMLTYQWASYVIQGLTHPITWQPRIKKTACQVNFGKFIFWIIFNLYWKFISSRWLFFRNAATCYIICRYHMKDLTVVYFTVCIVRKIMLLSKSLSRYLWWSVFALCSIVLPWITMR